MRRIATIVALAGALTAGCEGITTLPVAPVPSPFPASPDEALRRLEWSWDRRDTVAYRRLFTSDFEFVFAALDTAGSAWRTTPWGRAQELQAWAHMVGGGTIYPPITSATMLLDGEFVSLPDPREGHGDFGVYRTIRTSIALQTVDANGSILSTRGAGLFFFVRGDSAAIPDEVRAELDRPANTVWFIQRWEDETYGTGGAGTARALPSRSTSLGAIKARYL